MLEVREFQDCSGEIEHILAIAADIPQYAREIEIPPGIYGGYDPAEITDRSAFVILEKPNPTLENPYPRLRCRRIQDLSIDSDGHKGVTMLKQARRIIEMDKKYRFTSLCVDATNEKSVLEYLQEYFFSRVEGVKFSKPLKKELITTVRVVFQEKFIQLDPTHTNHSILRRELYELNPETLKHPEKGTDDFAWALALAIKAANAGRFKSGVDSGEANDVPLYF
jgi:hypothetical protein